MINKNWSSAEVEDNDKSQTDINNQTSYMIELK